MYEIEGLILSGSSLRLLINGIGDDGVSWVKMRQARQDLYVRENHMCQGLKKPVNKRLLKNVKYIEAGEKSYS